jgi:hypothetical protein
LECLEWLGINRNCFLETEGPATISSDVQGPQRNLLEEQGFGAKFVGYNESGIFSNGKIHGPSPWGHGLSRAVESMVDQRAARTMGAAAHGRRGARRALGLADGTRDEEGDEAKPRGCSPEHRRW